MPHTCSSIFSSAMVSSCSYKKEAASPQHPVSDTGKEFWDASHLKSRKEYNFSPGSLRERANHP